MLSNIILAILGLYTVLSPFLIIYGIQLGFKMAQRPEEAAAEPVIKLPRRKKTPQMSAEVRRGFEILRNIDIYDGTANGQKEIRHE